MFDLRAKSPNEAEMARREARKAAIELLNAGVSNEDVIAQIPGMTLEIIAEIFADGCVLRRPSKNDFAMPFRCSDADLH
jgi:hypothetical protein